MESALQVDLSNETVRLPLYKGTVRTARPVWFVLLDASDPGLAHDLGVNYAPKLANVAHRLPGLRPDGDARLADARRTTASGRRS